MTTLIADAPRLSFRFVPRGISLRCAAPEAQDRHLPADGVLRVARPLGRTVSCLEGTLWLTHDGDCRDVILPAGCSHRCDRDTKLIVQALAGVAKLRLL